MNQKGVIMIEMVFFFVYTEAMSVHQPRYFCGSILGDTLMKYNCVYHEEKALDYVVGYSGIVKECCFQRCSEYDLVKSYCSKSNIDSILRESPTTPNNFNEEIPSYSDEISRNMQKDESSKNGNDFRRNFVDEEAIVKSPVVGLTNFSRNSIIRVPLHNNNIQKD